MENKRNGWHTDFLDIKRHYRKGKLHRKDGPALIEPDGTQRWYRYGKRHRKDGPAIIWKKGGRDWWLNGEKARMEDVLDTPEKREAYLLEESLRRL